jgi:hypothetical protein
MSTTEAVIGSSETAVKLQPAGPHVSAIETKSSMRAIGQSSAPTIAPRPSARIRASGGG